jgi:riboflavin biosynthesis pyrimidine reductase
VYPPAAEAYAAWRRALGLDAPQPTSVIVSASGDIDPDHPGLSDPGVPVVIITTSRGATRLRAARLPGTIDVVVAGSDDRVEPASIVDILRDHRLDVVVCEGGPNLLGGLVEGGFVEEMFLTVAPQLAGRSPSSPRLALVEGVAFDITEAPWSRLISVMRAEDHLFLRYRVDAQPEHQGGTR